MTTNLEILQHELRVQQMLVEEHKARARRLAIEAAFHRKLWKGARNGYHPESDMVPTPAQGRNGGAT